MTKVYAIISAYNGADPDIESCYFDCEKAIKHLYELCSQWNKWLPKFEKEKQHGPYLVDDTDYYIYYETDGAVGHYRQEVANIRVLEVE